MSLQGNTIIIVGLYISKRLKIAKHNVPTKETRYVKWGGKKARWGVN